MSRHARPLDESEHAGAVPGEPSTVEGPERWWCAHCASDVASHDALVMRSGRSRCPTCHKRLVGLEDARAAARDVTGTGKPGGSPGAGTEDEQVKAPWHFKVLVVGTVGYLVYRLVWFVFWLAGHSWHG